MRCGCGWVGAVVALLMTAASVVVGPPTPAGAESFPGANGKIAAEVSGLIELFNPDGDGDIDTLTSGEEPSWSPDGTKLVFTRNGADVWVIGADGSSPTQLFDGPCCESANPSWSPDGTKIVFTQWDGILDCPMISVMGADGSDPTPMSNPWFDPDDPDNPDEPAQLCGWDPTWSPDGSKIAFSEYPFPHITVVSADGSDKSRPGSGTLGEQHEPAWSPDGARIAYRQGSSITNWDIWVMNADGSDKHNLTNTPSVNERATMWAPDGTKVAYHASPGGFTTINPDGSDPVSTGIFLTTASWQPLVGPPPPPPPPPPCPTLQNGDWIGTWASASGLFGGAAEAHVTTTGSALAGTISLVTGSSAILPGAAISGTISCEEVTFTVGGVSFEGLIAPDGKTVSGTYDAPAFSDAGNFWVAAVTQSVSSAGPTLTTDPGGGGPTSSQPVHVTITSPVPGPLSVQRADSGGLTVLGYQLAGYVVRIGAPTATATDPHTFTFDIDGASVGGVPASLIGVFRNGVLVPSCTGPIGDAVPDPCVSARTNLPSGDRRVTVLTSQASVWGLGVPVSTGPTVSVGDASVVEGDEGKPRSLAFPVVLSEPATTTVTVQYSIEANTPAHAHGCNSKSTCPPKGSADFRVRSGTVTFKPSASGVSATTRYVTAPVYPDADVEDDETLRVVLSSPSGGFGLGDAVGTGTILDDELVGSEPQVSVGDVSIPEGDIGKTAKARNPAKVAVTLSHPATQTVSVTVTVEGGSAVAGTDFKKGFTKTLIFKPGQHKKLVSVPVTPDLDTEGDETVTVTLSNPSTGLSIGRIQGTVTIVNDD